MRDRELARTEEAAARALGRRRVPDVLRFEDRLTQLFGDDRTVVHHEEEQQRSSLVLHPAHADDDLAAGWDVVHRVVHQDAESVGELIVIGEAFFEVLRVDLQLHVLQIGERHEAIGDATDDIGDGQLTSRGRRLFDFRRELEGGEDLLDRACGIGEERIVAARTRRREQRVMQRA